MVFGAFFQAVFPSIGSLQCNDYPVLQADASADLFWAAGLIYTYYVNAVFILPSEILYLYKVAIS